MKKILTILMLLATSVSFAKTSEMTVGGRRFVVVSPRTKPTEKRPLLLVLHGCKQSPEIILEGTRLGEVAVQKNFYVIAPEQTIYENYDHCWNWFLSYEQTRVPVNQMGQMIAAIQLMVTTAQVDPAQIYVTGMSAGGVMAHNLVSCYPDVFRGAALSAGLAYKIAENLYEASTVLDANHFKSPNYLGKAAFACGRQALTKRRLEKMLLIHGEEDTRVDPFHSRLISDVNQVTLDYYDDGKKNNSATFSESTTRRDLSGFGVSIRDRRYSTMKFTERLILVQGMAHAWGGGKPISENFDPNAPSTNDFILNFFQL